MAEYTRISLRQARESTAAALSAVDDALRHMADHEASPLTTTLAGAKSDLLQVAQSLALADEYITRKAGLLPGTTSGSSPAK